jgi:hypothetical protein
MRTDFVDVDAAMVGFGSNKAQPFLLTPITGELR